MGSTYSNIHVKSKPASDVTDVLKLIPAMLPAYVAENSNDWFSVYPEEVDYTTFRQLCKRLSAETKSSCIGISVHDSDVLQFVICEKGKIVDEYNSWPDYFDDGDPEPTGGKAKVLGKYCLQATSSKQLVEVLHDHGAAVDGLSKAEELAKHFGIDTHQVHFGYAYIAGARENALKFSPILIEPTGECASIEEQEVKTGPPILVDGLTYFKQNCEDDYELKEYEKEWKKEAKKDTVDMEIDGGSLISDCYETHGRTTSVYNNGGPCKGVTILIKGGAIEREMLTDWSLKLIPIPIGMEQECKLTSFEAGVFRVDCHDVSANPQLNIEIEARGNVLGVDTFTVEVLPLQKDGQSSFKHEYWVSVCPNRMAALASVQKAGDAIGSMFRSTKKVRK